MSELELECFNRQQKEFLVSISIHKARNLNVFNADTFVAVTFNGDTKKTKTFQCSDCPFYNEVTIINFNWESIINFLLSILFLKLGPRWMIC